MINSTLKIFVKKFVKLKGDLYRIVRMSTNFYEFAKFER